MACNCSPAVAIGEKKSGNAVSSPPSRLAAARIARCHKIAQRMVLDIRSLDQHAFLPARGTTLFEELCLQPFGKFFKCDRQRDIRRAPTDSDYIEHRRWVNALSAIIWPPSISDYRRRRHRPFDRRSRRSTDRIGNYRALRRNTGQSEKFASFES